MLLDALLPAFFASSAAAPQVRVAQEAPMEKRTYLADPSYWSFFAFGRPTKADVAVTDFTVLSNSAWYSAVRYISEGVAMLDRKVKRSMSGRVQEVTSHPVAELLAHEPHPFYSWHDLLAALLTNACHGNGYARIWRDPVSLRPVYVEHIPSSCVVVEYAPNGGLSYRICGTIAGRSISALIPPSDMIHVKGLSLDAITGLSTGLLHTDIHGTAIARNQFTAAMMGQQARPSLAITSEDDLTWEDLKLARQNFESQYSGSVNAGVPLFLGKGQKIEYLQWSPVEAGLEQIAHLGVADVARLTKVPLDMLGIENGGTYGAGVQRSKDFLTHCLRPWVERLQEEFTRKLFYLSEHGRYYFEFDLSMYLELDREAEAKVLATLVSSTIMTPNEARKRLGLEEVAGGDQLLTDINQVPLENVLEVAMAKYLSAKGEAEANAKAAEDAAKELSDKNAPLGQSDSDGKEAPAPR